MSEEVEGTAVFTSEMIETMARIWTRSSISLIDVRHQTIGPNEPLQKYRMPSSMLVYAYGGAADVQLNDTSFSMERFGLFHGGKGSTLSIFPDNVRLTSFMVHYRAETPSFFKKDLQRLLERVNPFVQLYGFAPSNPVGLVNLFQQMLDNWNQATAMKQFHSKSLFYQSMHQIYRDLERESVQFLQPDIVTAAKRYLDERYTQPISIQEMATMFSISGGQLTRLFKGREGKSLQQYLIQKRLDDARAHLVKTEATIREIAASSGFIDEINLIRMFKKYYRLTPGQYRKNNAMAMQVHDIDNNSHSLYNEKGPGDPAKSYRDGEFSMLGQARSKQMIVAAAMSLMLLLSACTSATPTPTNTGGAASSAPVQTQAALNGESNGAEAVSQTRTIRTAMGDVEVPVNPERVVVNAWWVGDVVALGVTPVAIQNLYSTGNGYEAKTSGVKRLEKWEAEDIMSETPDLIITGYERNYEALSKIAPTVFVPYDMPDEERLPLLALALGKEAADGTALLDAFNERVAEAKARLKEAGVLDKTITVARGGSEIEIQWTNWWGGSIVYDKFGMRMPDALEELKKNNPTMFSDVISLEVLPQYIGDYILMNHSGDSEQTVYQDSPVWQAIPAVKNGNIIGIDAAILFFADISSQHVQLDLITEALLQLQ